MSSKSAFSTLKIILVIDLIIVAIAAPAFLYVNALVPKVAVFEVTNLVVEPDLVQIGEPVQISVDVSNLGDKSGDHMVILIIDEEPVATETVQLSGNENATLLFTSTELTVGDHTVKIEELTGSLQITVDAPISPAKLEVTNLGISRAEAGVGETIIVSATATNIGDFAGDFSLDLLINNEKRETKSLQLESEVSEIVQFEVIENTEGNYLVTLDDLTTSFKITSDAKPAQPAEFQVTDLVIDPLSVVDNEIVTVSVKVTNIGEETGSYSVELLIDATTRDIEEVTLSGGVTQIVEFEIAETNSGTHTVVIDTLSGSFDVEILAPASEHIEIKSLKVNPYEVSEGDTVTLTAKATNLVNEPGTLQARVLINGEVYATKGFDLAASESNVSIELSVAAESVAGYPVKLVNLGNEENILSGYFKVVPAGMHTLTIGSYPILGVPFKLNGEEYKAPYSQLLPEAEYTIEVDPTYDGGRYTFIGWEDGSTSLSRTITLAERISITPDFSGGISCPSLYTWNGTDYFYNAEISNAGFLGYMGYMDEKGSIVFLGGNPWDAVKLNKDQFVLKDLGEDSYYDIILTQRWHEIFYLDSAYMIVVDHPSEVDVYSTMVRYSNPAFSDKIYSVSNNPLTPISAFNEKGEDLLFHISEIDGIFTSASNGVTSTSLDNISWNRLTLNLGELSGAHEIKLIINGMVDWGPADDYYDWIEKFDLAFAEGRISNGTELYPPPYMEVLDENGNWVRVPESRQMPIPADYVARPFVVDLTGVFLTNNYSIRINNFWNVTFDSIKVDISQQENIRTQRIDPIADLYQIFDSFSNVEGNFTRYGDVTELVNDCDDIFVIGMQGDEVSLHFPVANLAPPEEGAERDFFFFAALWFKDVPDNWGYGFEFTVDPLPFRNMTGFPYSDSESYPYDAEHLTYIKEYNTRSIKLPNQIQKASLSIWVGSVILLIAFVDLGIIVYFQKRNN